VASSHMLVDRALACPTDLWVIRLGMYALRSSGDLVMSELQVTGAMVLDGQMCEEIRMGIAARQAFGGRGYRHKDPTKRGPSMSFSSTVLDVAGGFKKFLEEWEEDPNW